MKISEYIEKLKDIKKEKGDVKLYQYTFGVGNEVLCTDMGCSVLRECNDKNIIVLSPNLMEQKLIRVTMKKE